MIAILLALLLSGSVFAQTTTTAATTPPAKGETEELVDAAKDAKARRKSPTSKVITNADVKKSKGKLIELPVKDLPVEEKAAPVDRDLEYRQRRELEEKIAVATAKVEELEKELRDLESRYYEENDPDRRDHVIRKRFEETQKQLNEAREALALLTPVTPAPPAVTETVTNATP
jgi:hypothetical protein